MWKRNYLKSPIEKFSNKERWVLVIASVLGLTVVNWPGQQITIGLFQSGDYGLLIPSLYGTLINLFIVTGVINLICLNARQVNFNVMMESLKLFLSVSVVESAIDIGYLVLLATAINWTGVIDVLLTNLAIHFFFFYVPALIYGIVKASSKTNVESHKKIEIRDGHSTVLIAPTELRYVESDANYVKYHTTMEVVLERSSLTNVEERLPVGFVRCHRSFIVNTATIDKITAGHVEIDGEKIPIGRKYKSNLT